GPAIARWCEPRYRRRCTLHRGERRHAVPGRWRRGSPVVPLVRVVVLVLLLEQVVHFFFENQQGRGLGEGLLLACQLALQAADSLRHRRRGRLAVVEGEPPALQLGQLDTLAPEKRGQPVTVEVCRIGDDARLLGDGPCPLLRSVGGHHREATRIRQPPRQVLLPQAGL